MLQIPGTTVMASCSVTRTHLPEYNTTCIIEDGKRCEVKENNVEIINV